MNSKQNFFIVIVLLFVLQSCSQESVRPPIAKKIPKTLEKHGHERVDDYYWLNERENSDVIDYLNAENDYTKSMLKHTEEFQEKLFDEMKSRIKKDDQSVPYKQNGYYYITKYEKDKEYPIYSRKKGSLDASEEIMLNVNDMVGSHSYFSVRTPNVSPNNKLIGFAVDTVSRRNYTIMFKNLETGKVLKDEIPKTSGGFTWANDNKTIFYTVKDPVTLRSYKIMKHVIGTNISEDKLVYEEKDTQFSCYTFKTKSLKYIFISSSMTESNEYRYIDADKPNSKFELIAKREPGFEYRVSHYKNDFYFRTSWKAKNFRLMKTSINKTNRKYWKEVIPHRKDVLLTGIDIFKNFLVVEEKKNALNHIRIIKWKDNSEHYLNFGEEAYSSYTTTNLDFNTNNLRYGYSSFTTPNSTYEYDMETRKKKLLKKAEVIGGHNPDDYVSKRLYAKARDGVKIPISLVYKKSLKKDKNPLLLYSYGSYGSGRNARFSSTRLSLLDRGFVYAIAHIRGGDDLGNEWYETGKLLNKINTFTDFIDCGKFLLDEGFTTKNQLVARGGSAGGLLMGAVVNMEPNMFKAVHAAVPFVDVVTTMLDETIPLTTFEYKEWGNPNEKKYYDYMLSYSPYDNVKKQNYPALLVTTGLHDSQVQYWEPAKWVAKLRDMKTDNNLLILDTNMETGHGGTTGRFKWLKQRAKEYAFMFDQVGIYQ